MIWKYENTGRHKKSVDFAYMSDFIKRSGVKGIYTIQCDLSEDCMLRAHRLILAKIACLGQRKLGLSKVVLRIRSNFF